MFLICFSAISDFSTQTMGVTLSATQLRDCVQLSIVDDNVLDPDEVFRVTLTTSTAGATVRSDLSSATVTITDDDMGK